MRDLLVTTHTPALRSGRALRTYGLARALAAHGGLDLLYVRFGGARPDAAFGAIAGVRLHAVEPSRGARRILAYARARARGVPAGFARGVSPELAAAAGRLAADPERRRVIADGPIAAAALAPLARSRPVIYNAHNLESGFRHELERGGLASRLRGVELRGFERRLLARAAESWMVSEADIAGARALCPAARLRYVPNVVDVAAIEPVGGAEEGRTGAPGEPAGASLSSPPRAESEPPRAIFVASFVYEPNRNALRFLLDDVFPRVWRELPHARLALVGAGLQRPPSEDERVEAHGFVEDLHAAYARARCAVVPLLQGGGTPLKLIEALAHGLPTIATSRAGAGLGLRDGVHCLLADDAESFAAALVRVLGAREGDAEELQALGLRGRALAQERYSIEALSGMVAPQGLTD